MKELKSEGEKIREGDGGMRPYRRTVFKDGTD